MSSKLAYGALISLGLTAFTVITTIYPLVYNPSLDTNNYYNVEGVRKLIKDLNLNVKNYGDPYQIDNYSEVHIRNITTNITNNKNYCNSNIHNNNKNQDIFTAILAIKDGNLKEIDYSLKCFIELENNYPNPIVWYLVRSSLLQKIYTGDYKINSSNTVINKTKSTDDINGNIKSQESNKNQLIIEESKINKRIYEILKKEDVSCNDISKKFPNKNNTSIIPSKTFFINLTNLINGSISKLSSLTNEHLCSYTEINNMSNSLKKYYYVVNMMNNNYHDNSVIQITSTFQQFMNGLNWIFLSVLVAGPIVFYLWVKQGIEL